MPCYLCGSLRRLYYPFLSNTSQCITAPRLKVRPMSHMQVKVIIKNNIFLVYVYNFATDGDRIPVGARFCAPVPTGPLAHRASCIVAGQCVSFSGLKRPEYGVDHSPPSIYKVICILGLFSTCLTLEILLHFCLHVIIYSCICGRRP